MKSIELYNDHFQNFKVYGIPHARQTPFQRGSAGCSIPLNDSSVLVMTDKDKELVSRAQSAGYDFMLLDELMMQTESSEAYWMIHNISYHRYLREAGDQ